MKSFNLFDTVKTIEEITLSNGDIAPIDTIGVIVEIYNDGEAYEVELFGNWVKYDEQGNFVSATQAEKEAFMETIGVEIVYPNQLVLAVNAKEIMQVTA